MPKIPPKRIRVHHASDPKPLHTVIAATVVGVLFFIVVNGFFDVVHMIAKVAGGLK